MFDDRLAEGNAFAGIIACRLESGARHANRLGCDADASAFQIGKGDLVAFAFSAQPVFDRSAHIGEAERTGVG